MADNDERSEDEDAPRRAESGPMQFGEDWPGVFIRGDNAFGFAMALKAVLENPGDVFQRHVVDGLVSTLLSCDVRTKPEVTKLRAFGACLDGPSNPDNPLTQWRALPDERREMVISTLISNVLDVRQLRDTAKHRRLKAIANRYDDALLAFESAALVLGFRLNFASSAVASVVPMVSSKRRAPVRASALGPSGSVGWTEHMAAWEVYAKSRLVDPGDIPSGPSGDDIAQMGGFTYDELVEHLGYEPRTWRRDE